MMPVLRDQLQQLLGSTYTIERELGGGGMSRVFTATEPALGRKVVIKVLPPEVAAGVKVERFKREIQFMARLNIHILSPCSPRVAKAGCRTTSCRSCRENRCGRGSSSTASSRWRTSC